MKHKLIMENWRRFQDEQDDRLIVEGKKKSFESLMLEVDQGSLSCVTVAIALSEQVGRQITLLEKQLNENFLKNMAKKFLNKATSFAMKKISDLAKLAKKVMPKNLEKVMKIGNGIVNKIASFGKMLADKGVVLGAAALKVAAMYGLSALLSMGIAHGGISSVTLEQINGTIGVVGQPVATQQVDVKTADFTMQQGELPTDALGVVGSGDDSQVERTAVEIGKQFDRETIKTVEALQALAVKAERKGGSLTGPEIEENLKTLDALVADRVAEQLETFKQLESEGGAEAAEDGKKMGVEVLSIIRSMNTKNLDDTEGVTGGLGMQTYGDAVYTQKSLKVPAK